MLLQLYTGIARMIDEYVSKIVEGKLARFDRVTGKIIGFWSLFFLVLQHTFYSVHHIPTPRFGCLYAASSQV